MNEEKKIAKAIVEAQALREESYTGETEEFPTGYSKDIETCLIETCKSNDLSVNLWSLLGLAMHWWNDIQLWAEDVLAGRLVSDSMISKGCTCTDLDQGFDFDCPVHNV